MYMAIGLPLALALHPDVSFATYTAGTLRRRQREAPLYLMATGPGRLLVFPGYGLDKQLAPRDNMACPIPALQSA